MPRHVREPFVADEKRDELMRVLVEELKQPKEIGQPVGLEDYTPETNSRRVHVIWNRWAECDRALRSGIILDAYREAFGEDYRRQITLALGVTVLEAYAIALLPFSVTPRRINGQGPSNEEYEQAMKAVGTSVFPNDDAPHLRFATLEDAEATMQLLEEKLPNSKWKITEEVTSEGD